MLNNQSRLSLSAVAYMDNTFKCLWQVYSYYTFTRSSEIHELYIYSEHRSNSSDTNTELQILSLRNRLAVGLYV